MSSVFDDVAAIAKAQTEAYHTAYQEGYLQGFRDATAQAKAIIERAFPHFEKETTVDLPDIPVAGQMKGQLGVPTNLEPPEMK